MLTFTQGIIQLLNLSSAIYKVGMPVCVILLFFLVLARKIVTKEKIETPFWGYFLAFILVSIISKTNAVIPLFSYSYFLIYTCLSYVYFLVIVNDENLDRYRFIIKIAVIFYIIQIPASWIKYVTVGQQELYIGTISVSSGSLSTFVPLFAITCLIALYFFKPDKLQILLMIGFFFVGVIGHKRALVFFIPITVIAIYLIYNLKARKLVSFKSLRFMVFVALASLSVFYFAVRLNPTLNPDNKFWGRFDYQYFTEYAENYTSSEGRSHQEMRRKDGLIYFANYLYNSETTNFLFGDGAGRLVDSRYTASSNDMLSLYGVRYGGRMSFVWLYLQVGAMGLLVYLAFILKIAHMVWLNYKNNPYYLMFLGMTFIYLLDFFTYSNVFLRYHCLSTLHMFLAGLLYLDIRGVVNINAVFNRRDV
jgi:hypothetical protein